MKKVIITSIVGVAVATAVLLLVFPKCELSIYLNSHLSTLIGSDHLGNLEPRSALAAASVSTILLVIGFWRPRPRVYDDCDEDVSRWRAANRW